MPLHIRCHGTGTGNYTKCRQTFIFYKCSRWIDGVHLIDAAVRQVIFISTHTLHLASVCFYFFVFFSFSFNVNGFVVALASLPSYFTCATIFLLNRTFACESFIFRFLFFHSQYSRVCMYPCT